jgi:hypothetical protein
MVLVKDGTLCIDRKGLILSFPKEVPYSFSLIVIGIKF